MHAVYLCISLNDAILIKLRRDGAMTALLSGVVVVLILCHTPKTIINMYESYQVRNKNVEKNIYIEKCILN